MTVKRPYIPLATKLASALAELQYLRGDPIPWKHLKALTAHQLVSLYQWDHSVFAAWDGGEHYTNITPRLILAHREKTAKRDVPAIAKVKRIARKAKMQETMMPVDVTGAMGDELDMSADARRARMAQLRQALFGTRPMPGSKASPYKRKINGKVEKRR